MTLIHTTATPNGGTLTLRLDTDLPGHAHICGLKEAQIRAALFTAGAALISAGAQVAGEKE